MCVCVCVCVCVCADLAVTRSWYQASALRGGHSDTGPAPLPGRGRGERVRLSGAWVSATTSERSKGRRLHTANRGEKVT